MGLCVSGGMKLVVILGICFVILGFVCKSYLFADTAFTQVLQETSVGADSTSSSSPSRPTAKENVPATVDAPPNSTQALAENAADRKFSREEDDMSIHCPNYEDVKCPASSVNRKHVAVFIVGLRNRLLFNSTIHSVIHPMVKDGFAVHVYVSLVDKGSGGAWAPMRQAGLEDPSIKNLTHTQLRRRFYYTIKDAGGCMMCFEMSTTPELLPIIPRNGVMDQRLWQYPPRNSKVGRNVLKVWKSRERLWNCAIQTEQQMGVQYSFALWTRDDAYWVDRVVNLNHLLSVRMPEKSVWSKNCKQWNGINDKVILSGRQAAEVMFRAYASFWKPRPLLSSWNSEQYLKELAIASGIKLRWLNHKSLPTGDGMLIAGPKPICISRFYWCGEALPGNLIFCEQVIKAPPPPKGRNSWRLRNRKHDKK